MITIYKMPDGVRVVNLIDYQQLEAKLTELQWGTPVHRRRAEVAEEREKILCEALEWYAEAGVGDYEGGDKARAAFESAYPTPDPEDGQP